ncbi:ParA family protein [Pseudomonas sp. HS-18]|uniref:ParA family protein n=1 Tax=Pseudomonas sp. HS-18 TaxID=2879114 RepID=UPI001CF03BB9|nr:ParA family protein [Pseudomonas sp. HS-18]UCL90233.1 ParA family protein [Pseudomonas sp. HS-18]
MIIFDNAPAASRLTKNSVAACDLQLCPIRMDKLSFRALNRLNDWLLRFAEDYKRSPALAVIPTMFIRNRPRILQHLALLNEYFPGRVTQENLYFSEDYSKAMDQGFPLLLWRNAKSDTLEAARKVYQEILQVVQKIGQALRWVLLLATQRSCGKHEGTVLLVATLATADIRRTENPPSPPAVAGSNTEAESVVRRSVASSNTHQH